MITLELPWAVSVNGLYFSRHGRLVLSDKGRAYHAAVAEAVRLAGSPKAPPGRLKAELDFYPPDKRKRDIANLEKCLTDALKDAGVVEDDCLIDRWVMTRLNVVKKGRVIVRLSPWEGAV